MVLSPAQIKAWCTSVFDSSSRVIQLTLPSSSLLGHGSEDLSKERTFLLSSTAFSHLQPVSLFEGSNPQSPTSPAFLQPSLSHPLSSTTNVLQRLKHTCSKEGEVVRLQDITWRSIARESYFLFPLNLDLWIGFFNLYVHLFPVRFIWLFISSDIMSRMRNVDNIVEMHRQIERFAR